MRAPAVFAAILGVAFHFVSAQAAVPAGAPTDATAQCKDGSWYSGATQKGACRGHKGVKDWFGAQASTPKTSAAAGAGSNATSTPATAPNTSAAGAPAEKSAANHRKGAEKAANRTAAAGGGPGLVWANTSTKTYHCANDQWYGKTKAGEYEKEADAKAKGFHAAHGKDCSS